jgi:teichuronic acid exporter
MIGQIVSTLISAVAGIFLARTLGAEQYGVYSIILIPVSIVFLIQDLGTSPALTRFCSMYRRQGRADDLGEVIRTGLVFVSLTSLALSVVLFFSSGVIASAFFHRPEIEGLLKIVSFAVFGSGLYGAVQSIFVGYERMGLRSVIDVSYSLVRGGFMIALLLVGLGTMGALFSVLVGYTMAGFLGVLLILVFIKPGRGSKSGWHTLDLMLAYGFPSYAGSLLMGGLSYWCSSLMTLYVSSALIGNYSAALNFTVLVGFVTMPIGTTLFPLFSKYSRGDSQLGMVFKKAVKYASLVTIPVMALLILVSGPLTQVIYGEGYAYAAFFLSLYLLTYAFEGMGGSSLSSLIMGVGESRVILWSGAATLLLGAPLALILIPRFQIVGLITVLIVAPRVGWLIQYMWVKRIIGLDVDWVNSAKIYFCSVVSFVAGYLAISLLHLSGWIALILGSAIFFSFYLVALPLSRTLSRVDLVNFREMAKITGPLNPVFDRILSLLQRLAPV